MFFLTHEVVIPGSLCRDHEEAKEPIREEHLDLLVVRGQVPVGIVARVLVVSAPLVTGRGQLVRRQRARARSEAEERERTPLLG